MSSRVGASGVKGSSRVECHGTEDVSEDSSNNKACSKAVRQRQRSADLAGEGKSSSVEQLVRPALPGQKAHKKTSSKDNEGRWREENQDREEDRLNAEYVEGRERGKLRQRKTERTAAHGAQDREGRGSTESLSSSNSDFHSNNILDAGEGSILQTGQSNACTLTNSASLNPQSPGPALSSMCSAPPQPPIQRRSTSLSPQRRSSRTAGELHCYSFRSPREPDPFWVEMRTGEGNVRSSQSHHTQTHIPPLTSSELGEEEEEEEVEEEENLEDGDEGGSGVMELMGQTMTSGVVPSYVPLGERKMSKRERNRIKCLRRRQRRRDRWRQNQLQESRQVNDANSLI